MLEGFSGSPRGCREMDLEPLVRQSIRRRKTADPDSLRQDPPVRREAALEEILMIGLLPKAAAELFVVVTAGHGERKEISLETSFDSERHGISFEFQVGIEKGLIAYRWQSARESGLSTVSA